MCRIGALVGLSALLLSSSVWAQDTFKINYFKVSSAGSETVTIVNPGAGATCALIYVFRPDQEIGECCGCSITPNATLQATVEKNFIANPVNGVPLTAGAIEIVSSAPSAGTCDPTHPVPTPDLREWITHVTSSGSGLNKSSAITETEFSASTLSSAEESNLATLCSITRATSGTGVCSCPTEAGESGS